jgi:NADH dehydrogenase
MQTRAKGVHRCGWRRARSSRRSQRAGATSGAGQAPILLDPGRRDGECPRVVIVGAGLGGLAAERALRRLPVAVTLVDAHNYSAFPPLLFEAAVGVIVPEAVVRPVRSFIRRSPHTTFRLGEVVGVDWGRRSVRLADHDGLPFDYLILAPGVVSWYGAVPGAAEHAVPLKTAIDATHIRNSIVRSFEAAAAHPGRAGPQATTIAIVGGGASGVELAGYLSDVLFRSFAEDYPLIAPDRMRVTVVELGARLLPGFHVRLGNYAEAALRARGVEVRLRCRVERIEADGLILEGGERIPASTVVWAGGVGAPPWLSEAGLPLVHRRVDIDDDLRLAGHPNTFVIGDAAAVRSSSGALRPQVAQVAIQGGRHAAHQIARLLAGRPTRRFRYLDKGSMAMVGVYAAVVESGRVRLTGRQAWNVWALLHVAYLPGMANRLRAMADWGWWHVTHEAGARVLLGDVGAGEASSVAVEPPPRPRTGAGS